MDIKNLQKKMGEIGQSLNTADFFKILGIEAEKKIRKKKMGIPKLPSKKWWKMTDSYFQMKHLIRARMDKDWIMGKPVFRGKNIMNLGEK